MVAAIAAFNESPAIGMYATRSHAATSSAGRPSRSAPTSSVIGLAPARAAARPVGQGRAPARCAPAAAPRPTPRAPAPRGRSRPCWPAPPWATTGRRSPARAPRTRHRRPGPRAAPCRRCRDRRSRAGRRTPAPAAWAPALLVHADRACSRPERADRRQRRRLHLGKPAPPSALPATRIALHRLPPRAAAAASRSSPSATKRPLRVRSRRRCRRRSSCRRGFWGEVMVVIWMWLDVLSLLGMERSLHGVLVEAGWRCGTKKAPSLWETLRVPIGQRGAREAGYVGGLEIRRPTPRGRPRQNVGTRRRRARRCPPAPCGRARPRPARGRA